MAHMQNPGVQPGVSRDLLCGGWSHSFTTGPEWRAQRIAARFALAPATAKRIASLHFGEEVGHD